MSYTVTANPDLFFENLSSLISRVTLSRLSSAFTTLKGQRSPPAVLLPRAPISFSRLGILATYPIEDVEQQFPEANKSLPGTLSDVTILIGFPFL